MEELNTRKYRPDVLIGQLAACFVVVMSIRIYGPKLGLTDIPFTIATILVFLITPLLYLCFLTKRDARLAQMIFRAWVLFMSILGVAISHLLVNEFWKVFTFCLELGFITTCMLIGVRGLLRSAEPDEVCKYAHIKIPAEFMNMLILIDSVVFIVGANCLIFLMLIVGKYVHDFIILNCSLSETQRILSFYLGMTIAFYPAKLASGLIWSFLIDLVNLTYKCCRSRPS